MRAIIRCLNLYSDFGRTLVFYTDKSVLAIEIEDLDKSFTLSFLNQYSAIKHKILKKIYSFTDSNFYNQVSVMDNLLVK